MIKSIIYIFLFITFIICYSCKQEEKLDNCATVKCAPLSIDLRLKFEDKHSGSNLFFGSNSKHNINDITIYSTRLKRNIVFKIDSTNISNKLFSFTLNSSDELNISLGRLSADVLKVETKFSKDACCGILEFSGVALNNAPSSFNNSNNNLTLVVIKI